MNTQPEALRLADGLENIFIANEWTSKAASELRRLHEVNQMLVEAAEMALEALNRNDYLGWQTNIYVREALRQALSKAKVIK